MSIGMVALVLVILAALTSYRGFTRPEYFEKYLFHSSRILTGKEYYRMFTVGFLHLDWPHLIFNMLALGACSWALEQQVGMVAFAVLYAASLLGGSAYTLFVNRNDDDYSAVGASGAVSGIVFASIALLPHQFLVFIPAWVFGIFYVLISIYGIRARWGNVGHDAHLGGAMTGFFLALCLSPESISPNLTEILIVGIPGTAFILLTLFKPNVLTFNEIPILSLLNVPVFRRKQRYFSVDDQYNSERQDRQQQIDHILDKINRKGIRSLTPAERALLDDFSKKGR